MNKLFFLLFLLSLIAIIIGLVNPKVVIRGGNAVKKNRRSVLKFYGISMIIFFILFGMTIEEPTQSSNLNDQESEVKVDNDLIPIVEPIDIEKNDSLEQDDQIITVENIVDKEDNKDPIVSSDLKVHFIDVGQADSILIITGSQSMLIDAGNNEDSNLVVNYLESHGISNLDYVIGTHPHEDHIGGLDAVINTFEIGKILMPKQLSTTKTFEDVLTAIQNKGLKVTTPVVGTTYELGEAQWTILSPSKESYDDVNNSSIVIKLEFGNNSFMFTGDAEELIEHIIVGKGDIKSDVLKVGHHGSNSSTSLSFLKAINPNYAVISVGKDNSYGHPHIDVLNRLNNQSVEVLRTDIVGTIIFSSDGNNLSYETTKEVYDGPAIVTTPVVEETLEISIQEESTTSSIEISHLDKKAELVTITNNSSNDVDLTGWKIVSVTGNQSFIFPLFTLKAGKNVTVGGYDSLNISDFDWEDGRGVWNNSKSDPAELYDASGNLISKFDN